MGQEEEYIQMLKIQKNLQVNGSFAVHGKLVQYSKKSLFFFDEKNIFRKAMVWLVEWKWFDLFIMLAILGNSVCLAMYDYSDRTGSSQYNIVLNIIGDAFTILFLVEAAIKIFAMGFILHKFAYIRDGWNFIDFVIVITGLLDLVASSINLKSLRTLRVLRPLRSINAIPSMRRLVSTLLQSLPELGNATIFLSFIIILFGILGLQQFNGILYYKCRLTPQPLNATYWPKSPFHPRVCSPGGDGAYTCPANLTCGSPDDYGISLEDDGVYNDAQIQYGISDFSHFGQSVMAVFQIITRDEWSSLMYNLVDGYTSIFSQIFCCSIIVLGSYFMLNLILAVIMSNFTRIQQQEAELDLIKKEEEMLRAEGKFKELEVSKISSDGGHSHRAQNKSHKDNSKKAKETFSPIKEDPEEDEMEFEKKGTKLEEKKELTPFQQLLQLKKQKDAQKKLQEEQQLNLQEELKKQELDQTDLVQKESVLSQFTNNTGKQMTQGLGLALFARALGLDKNQDEFAQFREEMSKANAVSDLKLKLEMQKKLYEQQAKLLNKMDFEIKKKYSMSKRNVYGIDNEQQIISQIKKSLKEILKKNRDLGRPMLASSPNKVQQLDQDVNSTAEDMEFIDPELDQNTQISLKITGTLKELTMKQKIKELIFTRFKNQLIKKNLLAKIFAKIEIQMTQNVLNLRAKKFFLLKVALVIAQSWIFQLISILAIVGNAVVLSMDSYRIDPKVSQVLEYCNLGCFSFFIFELILKLTAFGFRYYFRDKFNWFDSAVVLVSVVDVVFQYTSINNTSGSGAISALRVFRLIKLFQLAKVWKDFQDLLTVISNTVKDISNISILLLIFIFTYTLLGMDMFAYSTKFNKDNVLDLSDNGVYPQSNFNTFHEAFLSVFIVLANDGWTKIYFNHYRATNSVSSSFYFITLLIIGQFILLNLFIAILIENFEQVSVHTDTVNRHEKSRQKKSYTKSLKYIFCCEFRKTPVEPTAEEIQIEDKKAEESKKKDIEDQKLPSLYIFKVENRFRKYLNKQISSNRFEYIMLVMIIFSSIQLSVDNPLNNPESKLSVAMSIFDTALTIIFGVEAIIKIIALGFGFCGSTSYIRNWWNILDFLVVCLTIVSLSIQTKSAGSIKILRLLKVLRPLRFISRNEGLRISIRSLGLALPGIFNVIIVSLVFYLIFGIIGINYFKGSFYNCKHDHIFRSQRLIDIMDTKWDCINSGGEWVNNYQMFDNIAYSMQSLFLLSTTVQWQDMMYKGAASRGVDLMPQSLYNPAATIYFVAFIVVGNFFLLNLFVGVVISTYNREKEAVGKNFLLTEEQRKWLQNKIMLIQSKPMIRMKEPQSEFRLPFFYMAENKWFDRFILFCILSNTVVLAIQWYGQPHEIDKVTNTINYCFAGIFTLEVIIKFIAYGNRYFKGNWNNFDIMIVFLTLISISLTETNRVQLGPQTTIIRSFRIARIFKLFKRNKSLKAIFQTFLLTLPAMANIGSLLLLIIFIYSILGMYLFSGVKLNGALHANANFQNVGNAFLTLLRISTGEDWPSLLQACQVENTLLFQCINSPSYDDFAANGNQTVGCGDYYFSILYFYSYVLLISLIYLKLFIAIILQGFQDTTEKDNKFLDQDASDNFREEWSKFDPDATTFIRASSYPKFLLSLGEPMGWDASYEYNYLKQQEYLAEVNLNKCNNGKDYQFMDVFENLALLLIVKKEVQDYLKKYQDKLKNIEKIKTMIHAQESQDSPHKKMKRSPTKKQKGLAKKKTLAITEDTKVPSRSHNKSQFKFEEPEEQPSERPKNNLHMLFKDITQNVEGNRKKSNRSQDPKLKVQNANSFKLDEDIEAQIDALLEHNSLLESTHKQQQQDDNFEQWANDAKSNGGRR